LRGTREEEGTIWCSFPAKYSRKVVRISFVVSMGEADGPETGWARDFSQEHDRRIFPLASCFQERLLTARWKAGKLPLPTPDVAHPALYRKGVGEGAVEMLYFASVVVAG